jgi:hypothetical protein
VPPERREHNSALLRLVAMVEEVAGHATSLTPAGRVDIGRAP